MNTSNTLPALTIANICIGQDSQGRYCLNDLHKAAGNEAKHKPSEWLRNKQTTDLIEFLKYEESKAGIPAIQSKQQLGTFVVKELVYAYAMWISPAFHINVIRAYDAMVMHSNALPSLLNPANKTMTLAEFQAAQDYLTDMTEKLKTVEVVLTGADCLKLDLNKTLAKIKQEEREDFKIADTIIQMEYEGKPRHEIVKAVNRSFNCVRQVIFQARRDNILPTTPAKQGGAV